MNKKLSCLWCVLGSILLLQASPVAYGQSLPNGFNYPVGPRGIGGVTDKPDGDGWHDAQDWNVFNRDYGGYHPGEDWNKGSGRSDVGAPVYAVSYGVVTVVRQVYNKDGGYIGDVIVISHVLPDRQEIYSLYLHVKALPGISVYTTVFTDQPIATIADISTFSPHLHFEIRTLPISSNNLWPHDLGNGYYRSLVDLNADGIIDPSDFIDAHRPPTWSIIANPITGVAPLSVTFSYVNAPMSTEPLYFYWDFGDGQTSSLPQSQIHVYPQPGTYIATLKVYNQSYSFYKKSHATIIVSAGAPLCSSGSNAVCGQPPVTQSSPQLSIDDNLFSNRPQGQGAASTFTFKGTGFKGPATQHVRRAHDASFRIDTSIDVQNGSVGWSFTAICTSPADTYDVWVTDQGFSPAVESNHVTEIIESDPSCNTGGTPPSTTRGSSPQITSITLPNPVDGAAHWQVFFSDPDGDVNLIEFFEFSNSKQIWEDKGHWNPNVKGQTSGVIDTATSCDSVEVTSDVIYLKDAAGNKSAPYQFQINCVSTAGGQPIQQPPTSAGPVAHLTVAAYGGPGDIKEVNLLLIHEGESGTVVIPANQDFTFFAFLGIHSPKIPSSLDSEGQIANYEFFLDGSLKQSGISGIYGFGFPKPSNVTLGQHTATLRVTDTQGRTAEASATFTIVVAAKQQEICNNGIDDNGDGQIDEGCGVLQVFLEDTGPEKDDSFRLFVDGQSRGDTPNGGRRYYAIDGLTPGIHSVAILVVDAGGDVGTFTLTLVGGATFVGGGTVRYGCSADGACGPDQGPSQGQTQTFSIVVPSTSAASLVTQPESLHVATLTFRPIGAHSTRFVLVITGLGIASTQLQVFNLQGQAVFESGFRAGANLYWTALDVSGRPLANGVYFYVVTVRGFDGKVIRSEVKKVVVMR